MFSNPTVIYFTDCTVTIVGSRGCWTPTVRKPGTDYDSVMPSHKRKKDAVAAAKQLGRRPGSP